MELKLDARHKIVSDRMNYILLRLDDVKDKKSGEVIDKKWKEIGHYGLNLGLALKRYTTERIREEDKLIVEELAKVLKGLEQHVEKVVKKENIEFVHKKNDEELN
ncbi:hypothetical protein [uncultured Metabacillus sp.]|uniref:hypothetical protein n=1 Tax=uncultured Metabacillus sp. TaxID=2860135 RepID=UPI00261602DA|nr:hypothetical protein [uncultured Metabacillus sp.]